MTKRCEWHYYYFQLLSGEWGYVKAESLEHTKTKVKYERGEYPTHIEKGEEDEE